MVDNTRATLLASRCTPPTIVFKDVRREALLKTLDESTARITIISTPAGGGKTTLLAQWVYDKLPACAWLSVEPNADDDTRFWSYIIVALERCIPSFPTTVMLQSFAKRGGKNSLPLLLNAFEAIKKPLTLVIDDIQNIQSDEIWDGLGMLCENLPEKARIVLAGRKMPSIPLSRMSIEGRTQHLSLAQLGFSSVEANALFRSFGLSLSAEDKDVLLNASGAWPAILVALAQSYAAYPDNAAHTADLVSNPYVMDFIDEEVLADLPADSRKFLQAVAVFPSFSESMCETTLRSIDEALAFSTHNQIRYLFREQVLLERVIGRGYRCNPVLARILSARLKTREPETYRLLQRSIAASLKERGNQERAIPHALEGEDWQLATRLILENYSLLGMEAGFGDLYTWIDRIPGEYLDQFPELYIAKAMTLIPTGRVEESENLLEQAERLLDKQKSLGERPDNDFMVHCEIPIIRAYNNAFTKLSSEDLLRYSEQAKNELGTNQNEAIEGSVMLMNGIGSMLKGDYLDAEVAFKTVLNRVGNRETLFMPLLAAFYLAMLDYQRGLLRHAERLLSRALDATRGNEIASKNLQGIVHILMAWTLYDQNRLDECLEHALSGLANTRNWTTQTSLADAYEVLSYAYLALGNTEEATDLERQRRSEKRRSYPLFSHLSINRPNSIGLYTLTDADPESQVGMQRLWSRRHIAHGYIVREQWGEAEAALRKIADEARADGLLAYVLEAQMLRALLLDRRGASAEAEEAIAESLQIAQEHGQVRPFLDEGEPMRELLRHARKAGIEPGYTALLLRLFSDDAGESADIALSEREREVLSLLANGQPPKEIAKACYISVGTVRTHLHHIYEKLGVSGQTEAIVEAQRRNLIEP